MNRKSERHLLSPMGLTGLVGPGEIRGAKGSICLSSCIFRRMGLRTPQEIFRKPSTTTSPSPSCYTHRPKDTCTVYNYYNKFNNTTLYEPNVKGSYLLVINKSLQDIRCSCDKFFQIIKGDHNNVLF